MDGYTIATIILTVLLIAAGGYIRLLAKEMKELISTISCAIEDRHVTRAELKAIIKETNDVKDVILKISRLIAWKRVTPSTRMTY